MQSYAACSDPVIQEHVRAGYGDIVREVTRLSKEPPEKVWQFFATGMLLNVIASLDLAGDRRPRRRGRRPGASPAS